jgi:DNA mismatch repair protein MutS2
MITPLTPLQLAANTQNQLAWPTVLAQVLAHCQTPFGPTAWQTHTLFTTMLPAQTHMAQTQALRPHLSDSQAGWLPTVYAAHPQTAPLHAALVKVQKHGVLTVPELFALRLFLQQARQWSQAAQALPTDDSDLMAPLIEPLNALPFALRRRVNQWITEEGQLSEQASPSLSQLLTQQRTLQQAMARQMQTLLTDATLAPMLQNTQLVFKDGQQAFAVKPVYKHRFPGQLVGASASGGTVYMVPKAAAALEAKCQQVELAIATEIDRVMTEATHGWIQPECEVLLAGVEALAQLDRRIAGALWAVQQGANPVTLLPASSPAQLHIEGLRHPLLPNAVANTVKLGQPHRTLLITGPNTGGKTVLLKTLGLAVLLVQAGLPVPAYPGGVMRWMTEVYADIGDEQSLQQSLSTFSAHLVKLVCLTQAPLDNALVLLDEIAAGTDPTEGSVLAQAVLQALHQQGALTVVTTHLGSLKLFADQAEGFENASMMFDVETLSPTYRMQQGLPGTSHALSIAQRLGLPQAIVDNARQRMTVGEQDTGLLLETLASQQVKIQEELHRAESYRKESQAAYDRLNEQRQRLEQERKQLLHQLKTRIQTQTHDIQENLKRLRKRLVKTEQHLAEPNTRPSNQDRQHVGQLTQQLTDMTHRAQTVFEKADQPLAKLPKSKKLKQVAVGQTVFCKKLNMPVTIIAVQGDRIQVEAGLLKSYVHLTDLETGRPGMRPPTAKPTQYTGKVTLAYRDAADDKPGADPFSCDVRGKNTDDALAEVAMLLDQALIAGLSQVSVVHGLGTGVLKQAVRQYAQKQPYVKRCYPAQAVDGGDGKTIIQLAEG